MFIKRSHPPERDNIPTLESLGVALHPETVYYVENSEALANSLGGNGEPAPLYPSPLSSLMKGLKDVFSNHIVFAAAFSACMGGLLFGL